MNAAAAAIVLAMLGPTDAPARGPETVRDGLRWLAEQQKADGSWEGPNGLTPTTITATAGLAFLMEGSTPKEGTFAPQIRKAIAWIERNANDRGQLGGTTPNERGQYVPVHARGLLFLVCAYDVSDDPERRARLAKLLPKAIAYLIENQTDRGGWGFVAPSASGEYDDTVCTTTALQALLVTHKVGIEVPKAATDKAFQYLANATNANGGVAYGLYKGMPIDNGDASYSSMAAACALLCDGQRTGLVGKWATSAGRTDMPQIRALFRGRNSASALLRLQPLSLAAYALGDARHRKLDPEAPDASLLRWSAHRATMYKVLRDAQAKDGSWPDNSYGSAYATALALILLQLDNGYLPAFAR